MKKVRFPHEIRRGSIIVRVYRVRRPASENREARTLFTLAWHAGDKRHTKQFVDLGSAIEEGRLKVDQLAAGKSDLAAVMTMSDAETLREARRLAGSVPIVAALEEWLKAREVCGGALLQAAEAWREANGTVRNEITVAKAVDDFLADKRRQGVDVRCSYLATLPKLKTDLGGRPLASVSAKALGMWIHEAFRVDGAKHANPITHNTVRKRLVTLWRWARKRGYLPRSIQTEAEVIENAREEHVEIGIISVRDFAAVLELMRTEHPEYLAAAVVAGFCGLRRSEVHAQTWSDVNLERGFLRVTKAKRNTPAKRLVPIPPAAIEWLMLCDRSKTYKPPGGRHLTKAQRADRQPLDLIGPPWSVDRIRKHAREVGIETPDNAFRHAFISHRVAQTGSVDETSLEAGNSPAIVHRHYRELVSKQEGAAWFEITPALAQSMNARKVVALEN
jgi:integrase